MKSNVIPMQPAKQAEPDKITITIDNHEKSVVVLVTTGNDDASISFESGADFDRGTPMDTMLENIEEIAVNVYMDWQSGK